MMWIWIGYSAHDQRYRYSSTGSFAISNFHCRLRPPYGKIRVASLSKFDAMGLNTINNLMITQIALGQKDVFSIVEVPIIKLYPNSVER